MRSLAKTASSCKSRRGCQKSQSWCTAKPAVKSPQNLYAQHCTTEGSYEPCAMPDQKLAHVQKTRNTQQTLANPCEGQKCTRGTRDRLLLVDRHCHQPRARDLVRHCRWATPLAWQKTSYWIFKKILTLTLVGGTTVENLRAKRKPRWHNCGKPESKEKT